jgi:pyridoxamine 5'-phosphate oxidase family protein
MTVATSCVESLASEKEGDKKAGAAFSESEAEYLAENMLGRVATVSQSNQPHVVPVAYTFDGASIYFGGWNLHKSLKYRNLLANGKVAFVVDEVVSTRPWRVRGVEVRGDAQPHETDGNVTLVKITPRVVRSWGLGVK